ncbi:MAG: hypothetical protein ACJA06_002305 [Halocynthiibacter sp.]|jgi:hypothetical protein
MYMGYVTPIYIINWLDFSTFHSELTKLLQNSRLIERAIDRFRAKKSPISARNTRAFAPIWTSSQSHDLHRQT